MLRPATPLTLAFFVAFVLLLLATLSTPIIKSVPLGQNGGFNFGVFGFCPIGGGDCSTPQIGYPDQELNSPGQQDYSLSSNARRTLSYILVVHPVAAFMVLVCTILAGAAHFRKPAHSPRFLLFLLIFTFPTLLLTLLAFLVDVLIFIPHPQWGTWIVLPATIIVTACGVFTCAMRRTLVSRKARKKRIAENEDMNGSNYYNMKQEQQMKPAEATFARQSTYARAESPPPIDNSQTNGVATYDKMAQHSAHEYGRGIPSEDDRTPLNRRDLSVRSGSTSRYRDQQMSGSTMVGAASSRTRDDDPLEPVSPLEGPPRASSDSRRQRGAPMYGAYGRGGPPPGRGRGPPRGYYGPQRGGYPPRGGPRGDMRGGPPPGWNGPAQRGGPGMRRGPPPPGYVGYYGRSPSRSRDEYGPPPPMAYNGQGQDGQWLQQDPYAYNQQAEQRAPADGYGYEARSPSQSRGPSRQPSATRDPASFGFSGRQPSPARSQSAPRAESPPPPVPLMPNGAGGQAFEMVSNSAEPFNQIQQGPDNPSSPQQDEPAELPVSNHSPTTSRDQGAAPIAYHDPLVTQPHQNSSAPRKSNDFYEDIDPRFSEEGRPPMPQQPYQQGHSGPMPNALVPGPYDQGYTHDYRNDYPPQQHAEYLSPVENRDESRSPAHSDNSNFTSISQRGVNPEWRPDEYRRPPGSASVSRKPVNAVLDSNPDFVVPGAAPGRRPGHQRGMSSGGGGGRYPEAM